MEIRAKHDQPIDWVGPTQPPVMGKSGPKKRVGPHGGPQPQGSPHPLPRHGMQRTANTLGLKATAESEKYYIKKKCDVRSLIASVLKP